MLRHWDDGYVCIVVSVEAELRVVAKSHIFVSVDSSMRHVGL